MRWPTIVAVSIVLSLGIALFVYAQLSDSQTASGTVTVSSTAADLYICEPGATPGPDCGADDSDADETVFEGLENIRPGEIREWDIRLKNTGTEDFVVTGAPITILETTDPGGDCPDNALQPVQMGFFFPPAVPGVLLVGKNGDPVNDNPSGLTGLPAFAYESFGFVQTRNIKIAAGDYEDVRLRLQLPFGISSSPSPTAFPTATPASPTPAGSIENCSGNEWSVSFVFTVL